MTQNCTHTLDYLGSSLLQKDMNQQYQYQQLPDPPPHFDSQCQHLPSSLFSPCQSLQYMPYTLYLNDKKYQEIIAIHYTKLFSLNKIMFFCAVIICLNPLPPFFYAVHFTEYLENINVVSIYINSIDWAALNFTL